MKFKDPSFNSSDTTRRLDGIRATIYQNHNIICELLLRQAKHLGDFKWIKSQLMAEAKYLINPTRQKFDYKYIQNQKHTYDFILSQESKDIQPTHSEIKGIHERLAQNTIARNPGQLRQKNTKYINGLDLNIPDYQNLEILLRDISYRLTTTDLKTDVLDRAINFHYELFATQPFDDMNKRTARTVMNWFLIQNNLEPILFNYPSDASEYHGALISAANNDKKAYTKYMLKCLSRTQEDIIKILRHNIKSK